MESVYSTAVYLCGNPDEAADLMQDTFLRAYRAWDQFQPGTNCKAWLLKILYNTFCSQWRLARRSPPVVALEAAASEQGLAGESGGSADDPESLLTAGSFGEDIRSALQTLPEEYRQVVVLVDIEELSYGEAAEVLQCPVGTVRSRLARARTALRKTLLAARERKGRFRSG